MLHHGDVQGRGGGGWRGPAPAGGQEPEQEEADLQRGGVTWRGCEVGCLLTGSAEAMACSAAVLQCWLLQVPGSTAAAVSAPRHLHDLYTGRGGGGGGGELVQAVMRITGDMLV